MVERNDVEHTSQVIICNVADIMYIIGHEVVHGRLQENASTGEVMHHQAMSQRHRVTNK
jgi:hypothetical protein